jgi:hypothetical protein
MGTSHLQAQRYKVTHFELVYEQEAILPVEVNLNAL